MFSRASCVRSLMASWSKSKSVSSPGIPGSSSVQVWTGNLSRATVLHEPVIAGLRGLRRVSGRDRPSFGVWGSAQRAA